MSEATSIIEENEELKAKVAALTETILKHESDYNALLEDFDAFKVQTESMEGLNPMPTTEAPDDEEETEEDDDKEAGFPPSDDDDEDAEDDDEQAKDVELRVLRSTIANLATPAIATTEKEPPMSGDQAREQWALLGDHNAKASFFRQHREQLLSK